MFLCIKSAGILSRYLRFQHTKRSLEESIKLAIDPANYLIEDLYCERRCASHMGIYDTPPLPGLSVELKRIQLSTAHDKQVTGALYTIIYLSYTIVYVS